MLVAAVVCFVGKILALFCLLPSFTAAVSYLDNSECR